MKLRIILLLFIVAIIFVACDKRYEDGPCISFVKAENRVSGIWRIHEICVDNQPTANEACDTVEHFRLSFFMNNSKALFLAISDTSEKVFAECLVRYNDRITELSFEPITIEGYEASLAPLDRLIPPLAVDQTWTITRLKKSEMTLETLSNSRFYHMELRLLTDYPNL